MLGETVSLTGTAPCGKTDHTSPTPSQEHIPEKQAGYFTSRTGFNLTQRKVIGPSVPEEHDNKIKYQPNFSTITYDAYAYKAEVVQEVEYAAESVSDDYESEDDSNCNNTVGT